MQKSERIVLLIIILFIGFGFTVNFIANALLPVAERKIDRVILFSIDSGNPEYLSEEMMPKLFGEILEQGSKYKFAMGVLASETQHGHTTILTGAFTNNSGMIGNGYYDNETGKTTGVALDPNFRLAETIFEANPALTTAFISGKWRLPPLLAPGADLVLASQESGYTIPDRYVTRLGLPITYYDGDIVDRWCIDAVIEAIRIDDPDFIFCNLAWTDVFGHNSGGIGDYSESIKRQLRELDNLFMRLFIELKAMGEYENTLFCFVSDHGMETIDRVVDIEGYLSENGIPNHIHAEGASGYVFLTNSTQKDLAVQLLQQHADVSVVVPYENMSQYPYALNTLMNRTGHIYFSMHEHVGLSLHVSGLGEVPLSQIGSHGGISCQDVLMGWMGPNITRSGIELRNVPHQVDIVPTICYLTGWNLPSQAQGRVLYEILE